MARILFVMLHPGFVRYYESALLALADGGHEVHVAFEVHRSKLGEDVTAAKLATYSPRLTCGATPERSESVRDFLLRTDRSATRRMDGDPESSSADGQAWESLATTVRLLGDYLRFFDPAFAGAAALRARAGKRLPRLLARLAGTAARTGATGRAVCRAALARIEDLIPNPPALEAFLRAQRPDLLLVTPLVELGSQQVDYVKTARRLGIRSALCVASWDNLTSKGLVRVVPDHVIVWNEAQKGEAETMHGVPAERVVVTGAQLFDGWFTAQPSRSREAFCRHVGLDPARPFLLYVGSSSFIAPEEVPFVERWLRTVRRSPDPAVAEVGVLVRPHPSNSRQWRAFDAGAGTGTGAVALWPPIGTDPTAPDFRRDYFESLFYCAGVVGINTSAQIEAAIVGRPVFTIRAPEFAHAQEGTLHFQYLVGRTGPVRAADSFAEHLEQLSALFAGRAPFAEETRAFVASFVRPHGLDTPATPLFVRSVETLAAMPGPAAQRTPVWVRAMRPAARTLAHAARELSDDRPVWVHALRPALGAVIDMAAAGYDLQDRWRHRGRPSVKRMRRAVWRAWYESSRVVARRARRIERPIRRVARFASGVARRVVKRAS